MTTIQICDKCGKRVSDDSLDLHERVCGGRPVENSPNYEAETLLVAEIVRLCGAARAPTKGELRQAAISVINDLLAKARGQ